MIDLKWGRQFTFALGFGLLAAVAALAQPAVDQGDWKEDDVTSPPAFSTTEVLPLTMPPYVTLKFGIDPKTLSLGKDSVLRYVVVMTNSAGSSNAAYEGIRCATREVKTYARTNSKGEWIPTKDPEWKALNENMPSRHAMEFSRQGACDGAGFMTPNEVVSGLKAKGRDSKKKVFAN
jgi:CNP1-like family